MGITGQNCAEFFLKPDSCWNERALARDASIQNMCVFGGGGGQGWSWSKKAARQLLDAVEQTVDALRSCSQSCFHQFSEVGLCNLCVTWSLQPAEGYGCAISVVLGLGVRRRGGASRHRVVQPQNNTEPILHCSCMPRQWTEAPLHVHCSFSAVS